MSDLFLSPDGDLDLSTGDLRLTSGVEAVAQRVRVALETRTGECLLDVTYGLDTSSILTKNPDLRVVRALLRDVISGVLGVVEVQSLAVELDRSTRHLSFSFTALTELTSGELSSLQVDGSIGSFGLMLFDASGAGVV